MASGRTDEHGTLLIVIIRLLLNLHHRLERVMKVIENEYECDFCGRQFPFLYPINGGEWAICKECMEFEYGTIPEAYRSKEKPVVFRSKRYDIYGEEE